MGSSEVIPCIGCGSGDKPRCARGCPRLSSFVEAMHLPCAHCYGYFPGCSEDGGCDELMLYRRLKDAIADGLTEEELAECQRDISNWC